MSKTSVLFLCADDVVYSRMAGAFLTLYGGERFAGYSAGPELRQLDPLALQVMDEFDIELVDPRADAVRRPGTPLHFDYLVTLSKHPADRCADSSIAGRRLHWPLGATEDEVTPDVPLDCRLASLRENRDAIEARVLAWLEELDRDLVASASGGGARPNERSQSRPRHTSERRSLEPLSAQAAGRRDSRIDAEHSASRGEEDAMKWVGRVVGLTA